MSLSALLLRLPSLKAKTSVPPLLNHSSYTALTRCGLVEASHAGSRERGGGLRQTVEGQGALPESALVSDGGQNGTHAGASPERQDTRTPATSRARVDT